MGILKKFFQKKSIGTPTDYSIPYALFGGINGFDIDYQELWAAKALFFYRIISPANTAIDLIASEFSGLTPVVYDKKKKIYIDDHDVLKLLDHPYGDMTWCEFATEMATYYLATGNNYLSITGNVNRPPLELSNIYPGAVSIFASTIDGYNSNYIVSLPIGTTEYSRNEKLVPGYFRWLNKDEGSSGKELWHIRAFNPNNRPGLASYGMSPLTGIFYEIEQHLLSSQHNRALLENGAKLSTVFITNAVRKPETFERLKQQIEQFVGPKNTGKTMLLEEGFDVKELGLSNKDMDFLLLKKDMALAIFNKMRVPIPLVFPERTTMSNMEEARIQLYDNAVFPLADRMFKELSIFLMPRYKDSENLIITYKQDDVKALESRRIDQVGKKQKIGIFKINELRSMMGVDPDDNGDEIYHTTTELPISDTIDDEREPEAPKSTPDDSAQAKPTDKMPDDDAAEEKVEDDASEKRLFKTISNLRFANGAKVFEPPELLP